MTLLACTVGALGAGLATSGPLSGSASGPLSGPMNGPASATVASPAGTTAAPQGQRGTVRRQSGGRAGTGTQRPRSEMPLLEPADDYELEQWFVSCDVNEDRWISYYESERALSFTKQRFLSFDSDQDGRLDKQEFVSYYRHAYKNNEFVPPRRRNKSLPPQRTAEQLLLAYDADLNRGISLSETRRIVSDYSRETLDVDTLFARIDRDKSKLLDEGELAALSAAIRSVNSAPIEVPETVERKPVDEFFLRVIPSEGRAFPDRYAGPITMFRRLDTDGDGKVTPSDLDELQRTVITSLRPQTILHTLDTNQDGVLDRVEFVQAMETPRR